MKTPESVDVLRSARYEIIKALNKIDLQLRDLYGNNKRILYITPHLSTGGMPQYLLKKIEFFNQSHDVFCIQVDNTAEEYNVQRNKIRDLLGKKFFCVDGEEKKVLTLIDKISPDIIHFEDFVEFFFSEEIIEKIYSLERPYFIIETCHGSEYSIYNKMWIPDKFVMVNEYMAGRFSGYGVPVDIWEYPIENYNRPNREDSLSSLGLDPKKKHIINVGLFTPGKNQGELIEYANSLIGENYEFHFIGNTAPNFQHYWEPLLENLPENCIIWGERKDVGNFYSCADLFVFTSILELNPIVVKESLSWGLPILLKKLEVYGEKYDNNPLVHYLGDPLENIELIKKLLG